MAKKVTGQRGYFKQEIMRITGWSTAEYTKKYDVFKHRVRNYNLSTGQKLSASEQFYYKIRADRKARASNQRIGTTYNYIQTAINTTSAVTKSRQATLLSNTIGLPAQQQIQNRFRGLLGETGKMNNQAWQQKFWNYQQLFDSGQITLAEYNKRMGDLATEYSKQMKNANENNLIGSN